MKLHCNVEWVTYKKISSLLESGVYDVGAFHGNLPQVTQTGIQETTH
jgi:hypothetical protein